MIWQLLPSHVTALFWSWLVWSSVPMLCYPFLVLYSPCHLKSWIDSFCPAVPQFQVNLRRWSKCNILLLGSRPWWKLSWINISPKGIRLHSVYMSKFIICLKRKNSQINDSRKVLLSVNDIAIVLLTQYKWHSLQPCSRLECSYQAYPNLLYGMYMDNCKGIFIWKRWVCLLVSDRP